MSERIETSRKYVSPYDKNKSVIVTPRNGKEMEIKGYRGHELFLLAWGSKETVRGYMDVFFGERP